MMRCSQQDLEKRVCEYLKRAAKRGGDDAQMYPLRQVGTWRIVGGSTELGNYDIQTPLVRGRFIDAVAYAVQQGAFYGEWCGSDVDAVGNPNSGHVERYVLKIVDLKPNRSLDRIT